MICHLFLLPFRKANKLLFIKFMESLKNNGQLILIKILVIVHSNYGMEMVSNWKN